MTLSQYHSRIDGFYKLSPEERLQKVSEQSDKTFNAEVYQDTGNLPMPIADSMVENVIGTMNIPIGIATNLIIDGEERLVPMATEESSVVAAVCNAAKQCRSSGGFFTSMSSSVMIAQIQLMRLRNPEFARQIIYAHQEDIKAICDATDPTLLKFGGGFRDIEIRTLNDGVETVVVLHLLVDTRDAMGANAVNSMAEALAPALAEWTGGKVNLRILSNLADHRLARARATWYLEDIGGETVRDSILSAYRFAWADPYRAATHNKGIMNGVSAVVLATGNDTRAVEAGAHAYAAHTGQYRSLSHWECDKEGNLCGTLEMPLAVGLIGGATKVHPLAQQALKIMRIADAATLARTICAVGLAQNFAAIKALATTGIQKGHMALHAKNIALMAGASGDEVDALAKALVAGGKVRMDIAQDLLEKMRQS